MHQGQLPLLLYHRRTRPQSDQSGQYLLVGFAALVSLVLVIWLWRGRHSRISGISIGMIVGGAVANGIDRLHLGGVADFFDFHFSGFHWYVFNIADVAIVAGVLGLMYDSVAVSRGDAANRPQSDRQRTRQGE